MQLSKNELLGNQFLNRDDTNRSHLLELVGSLGPLASLLNVLIYGKDHVITHITGPIDTLLMLKLKLPLL